MPEVIEVFLVECRSVAARHTVDLIAQTLAAKPGARFGSATGGTMEPVYAEIASRYAERQLSLAKAEIFQLDEYYPIEPWHPQSYRTFLRQRVVDVTDLPRSGLNVLNGATSDPKRTCAWWDQKLKERPVDLQLLGIGVEGHIAFVEAGAEGARELPKSGTSLVKLHESTIRANSRYFGPDETQPTQALSVGIGTLLETVEHFVLLAFGSEKSRPMAAALLGDVSDASPASYVREAKGKTTVLLDHAAAADLLAGIQKQGGAPPHLSIKCL